MTAGPGSDLTFAISPDVARQFDLADSSHLTLSLGGRTAPVRVQVSGELAAEECRATSALVRRLLLPHPLRIQARRRSPGEVELGPVIGLLAAVHGRDLGDGRLPWITNDLEPVRDLTAMIVLFALDGLRAEMNAVEGLLYWPYGVDIPWRPGVFSVPRAVYKRWEVSERDQAWLDGLFGGRIFNRALHMPKEKLYAFMASLPAHPDLPRVPETHHPVLMETVRRRLNRWGAAYLKPIWGSRGDGVAHLQPEKRGFLLRKVTGSTVEEYRGSDLDTLFRQAGLMGRAAGGKADSAGTPHPSQRSGSTAEPSFLLDAGYVLQEPIPLLRLDGRAFDFRVMVQKEAPGAWAVTGMRARCSRRHDFISTVERDQYAAGQILRLALGPEAPVEALLLDLERKALHVAPLLEEYYGHTGEVGLDLGLDARGRVWFIEANPRPGLTTFKQVDVDMYRRVVQAPFRYASHLAGFPT